MALAKGKRGAEHPMAHARLSRWPVPAGCKRPGSHPAAPWIWPCKRGDVRRQRVTRPHERCGKLFAGMLPKRRKNAMAALALSKGRDVQYAVGLGPGSFGRLFSNRNRSPAIWKSASRKIRSPNLPTYRFFARLPHWGAASRRDSVERLQIALPYELAVNGLNFSPLSWRSALGLRAWRGVACRAPVCRKRPPNFRRFSIIAESSARIRSALWRTCNWGEHSLSRGTRSRRSCAYAGFPHALERRRPRHPDSQASEGRVRPAAVTFALRSPPAMRGRCPRPYSTQPHGHRRRRRPPGHSRRSADDDACCSISGRDLWCLRELPELLNVT